MTQHPDDRDLVERFAALRREEREAAPAFARVSARRARKRTHGVPLAVGFAAAVAAVVIVAVMIGRDGERPNAPAPLDLGAAHWTAPTDFLLNVPGDWLLRDLPKLATPASQPIDTVSYRRVSS